MLIKSEDKYIPSLIKLWNEVFGDSEEYIKLFFKNAYYDCNCFADIYADEVISVFYLLKCNIKYEGKTYNGRYLYAAATLPEYRGRGIMSKLIKEALVYGINENLDFIALLPADDSLYNYYERFGFKEAMYKYRLDVDETADRACNCCLISDADEFFKIRNSAECDMLVYNRIGTEYAFECMNFSGTEIISLGDNAYYATDEELFIGGCTDPEGVLTKISGEGVCTNYPYKNAVKVKNGMIYNFRNNIEFKDIYMNIALD